MNLAKNEKVQTIATIGGIVGFIGLIITVAKSKPVALALAKIRG